MSLFLSLIPYYTACPTTISNTQNALSVFSIILNICFPLTTVSLFGGKEMKIKLCYTSN